MELVKPRVSIVIPAYNTGRYIAKAIESALGQSERNVEVIVVDDASTDVTVEVVKGFSDDRLKVLVNERNRGPSYARNRALKEARGEWVALLDSDDWYAPKRLERLLQVAHAENADLIADDMYVIQDGVEYPLNTKFSGKGICFDEPRQIDSVDFVDLDLSITKPLIKRNFLVQHELKFNETLKYEEDFFLFLMCLLSGARFMLVPEPYYFYRTRLGSLMSEKVEFYEQAYNTNLYLLQQESIKKNPKLAHSLSGRFAKMKQNRAFYRVKQLLKEGAFLTALTEIVRNPSFFSASWMRLPGFLKNYHLFRRLAS